MDINTIFYFPSSLTFEEYSNKLDQGEISERTIVFADAQKAIYKGGKKYGGTSLQEFHDLIDTLYDDSWISDEINGVKSNVLQSITRLDQFNTLVTNVSSMLDTEIQERDNNIQAKVEALMEDAAWLQENFPQGVTQWDAGWNQNVEAYLQTVGYWTTDDNNQTITQWSKLKQDLNSIETSVNSLKVDGNLTQALTTSIQQLITDRIASLQLGTTYATVARIGDVEKVLEWMYSGLESSASEDTTFSEMSSMAKNDFVSAISDIRTQVDKVANGDFVAQTELASKVGDTVTAMLLQSSSDNALASMSARLDTVEQDTGTLSQNVASLVLGVTGSSSTANLATVVANKLAGFTTSADIASAKSEIYSAIGAKDGSGNFISIASLKTQADANGSNITAVTTRVGNLETNQSGFVSSSNLDSAVATLFANSSSSTGSAVANLAAKTYVDNKVATASTTLNASIDSVSASLNLAVKKDSNGKIESTAVLNADQINLQGQTNFQNAIGNAITAKSLDVIGGGNATISGDVIAKSLVAGPSDAMHIVTTGNEIHFMSGNTVMGKFVTEDNGLQIYVMGPDGNLYKVNFSNWTNTQSSGTSHTYNLYKNKQVSGSTTLYEVVQQTSVYGNGDNTYYSDQSGNNLASLGTSSTTGQYMRKIGSISQAILPAASGAASGVTYCIYSVDLYKDTYYSGGTQYDGPNVYGVFKDGVHNDTHYVISSSNTAGVSASSVYTTESGQNSCSSIPNLNFGSGNRYQATISYTPTAFGSGHVTRVQGGQNSATLVTY